jgi:hypothetical protein
VISVAASHLDLLKTLPFASGSLRVVNLSCNGLSSEDVADISPAFQRMMVRLHLQALLFLVVWVCHIATGSAHRRLELQQHDGDADAVASECVARAARYSNLKSHLPATCKRLQRWCVGCLLLRLTSFGCTRHLTCMHRLAARSRLQFFIPPHPRAQSLQLPPHTVRRTCRPHLAPCPALSLSSGGCRF